MLQEAGAAPAPAPAPPRPAQAGSAFEAWRFWGDAGQWVKRSNSVRPRQHTPYSIVARMASRRQDSAPEPPRRKICEETQKCDVSIFLKP